MSASVRKQAQVAERRAKALAMRAAGATFQQIADNVEGYKSAGAACQDVQRALDARAAELSRTAANAVTLELERLDTIDRACNVVMNNAQSRNDPVLVLRAADRVMRISDRRAVLLALASAAGRGAGSGGEDDEDEADPIDEVANRRHRRRGAAYG